MTETEKAKALQRRLATLTGELHRERVVRIKAERQAAALRRLLWRTRVELRQIKPPEQKPDAA